MKNNIFVGITFVFWGLFSVTATIAQQTVITVTDCTQFSGAGTISDAIARANIGGGTIDFACDEGAIITFADEFTITNTVTIDGGGVISFDGGGAITLLSGSLVIISSISKNTHFFTVNEGALLTLNGLTLQNGLGSLGGAIKNDGTLIINNSTLSGNYALYYGGAIYNNGDITITDSTLSDNVSASDGGAIYNNGDITITDSTLSDNAAASDGGIIYNNGTLSITDSTLSDNFVYRYGGVIYNNTSGILTLINAILSDNSAGNGGAIFNHKGTVTLNDSTLSNNYAYYGGAIYMLGGDITISNSTFINNQAHHGSAIYNHNGNLLIVTSEYIGNTCEGDDAIACVTTPVVVIASSPTPPSVITPSDIVLGCVLNNTDGAGDNTYCRLLMQNDAVVDFNGAVPADLIRLGVILAVDVYRLQGGATINTFPDYQYICLQGEGRFFYMDGRNAPRYSVEMGSEFVDGMTCAWIPAPGTVILTN